MYIFSALHFWIKLLTATFTATNFSPQSIFYIFFELFSRGHGHLATLIRKWGGGGIHGFSFLPQREFNTIREVDPKTKANRQKKNPKLSYFQCVYVKIKARGWDYDSVEYL